MRARQHRETVELFYPNYFDFFDTFLHQKYNQTLVAILNASRVFAFPIRKASLFQVNLFKIYQLNLTKNSTTYLAASATLVHAIKTLAWAK